jgi:hypothetical protein
MENQNRRDRLPELSECEQRGPSGWLILAVVAIAAATLLFPLYA